MRAKQSASLLREESISDSLNRRAFLVIPRIAVRLLRPIFFLLITSSAFAQTSSEPGTPSFDGQSWWNYVKVLADDNMEGRDTGSEGLKRAEAYIVEQLKADGLQPAGTDGYYQPVKLIARRTLENDSSLALFHDGKSEALSFERDAYFVNRISQAPKVDAPLVFLGWGLDIPEKGYSDLQGVDVNGKVAVLFIGWFSFGNSRASLCTLQCYQTALVGFEESRRNRDNLYPQSLQHGYPMGAAEGAQNSGRNGAGR
jgi:hypothetical protein